MVLLTVVDRKSFPVFVFFWLHWISIFITSTINSLTGKDTGNLEVSWIRLRFHKVLVSKPIELSTSVLSATGKESPAWNFIQVRLSQLALGFGTDTHYPPRR